MVLTLAVRVSVNVKTVSAGQDSVVEVGQVSVTVKIWV